MVKVSKRTGNRRLLKLAAMLLADAKNKKGIQFDIQTVGRPSDGSIQDMTKFAKNKAVPLDCGTTACAMGLAAISGKFNKAGLGYKIVKDDFVMPIHTTWNGRDRNYDQAAMQLFSITGREASYLFAPYTYPHNLRIGAKGEREVVRRIKRVVEGKPIINKLDKYI